MRVHYAIVLVSDMNRSVAFYRDVIGLPLRFESPGWTEFATDGATLALHLSHQPGPADEGRDSDDMPAGRCRPGLQVPDLKQFHERMQGLDVPCLQMPTTVFGAKVALYRDPDGLPLSVGEAGDD